jgi:tetratricopeptide (TPR) repeat protein
LGFIWFVSGLSEGHRNQEIAWTRARYYLNKAQTLDPSLINNEFYLLQGYFYFDWDFERLDQFYHNRFSKYTYDRESCGLIDYAIKTGRFRKALEVINKSIETDPLDASLVSFKARTLWFLGYKEESVRILENLEIINKNDWFYLREVTHSYFIMQEFEHSRRVLDIIMERFEDRGPILIWLKLFYAHMDNDSDLVKALLIELIEAYRNGNSGSPAWFIALYQLVIQKDKTKAFEWLEKSYDAKEVELTWFRQEPLLDPIRNDERYLSLYRKIGFDKLISN